jgi:hypothetical protein
MIDYLALAAFGALILAATSVVKRVLKLKDYWVLACSLLLAAATSLMAFYGRVTLTPGDPPVNGLEALLRGLLAAIVATGLHQQAKQARKAKGGGDVR